MVTGSPAATVDPLVVTTYLVGAPATDVTVLVVPVRFEPSVPVNV